MFDNALESVSSEEGYNRDSTAESSSSSSSSEDVMLSHHTQFMANLSLDSHHRGGHRGGGGGKFTKEAAKSKNINPTVPSVVPTRGTGSPVEESNGRWMAALEATALECGKCDNGKAMKKKKEKEEAEQRRKREAMMQQSLFTMPMLYDVDSRQPLEKMSAKEAAYLSTKATSTAESVVPELRLSYQQPITVPTQLANKMPASVKNAPVMKERSLPALLTEKEYQLSMRQGLGANSSSGPRRPLPPMQKIEQPVKTVFSMDQAFIERMATQNKFTQNIQSTGMKSLLMGNQFTLDKKPRRSNCPDESRESVLAHIENCHPVFYSLLKRNGIVDDIVNERRDFLYVIPTLETLKTIPPDTLTTEKVNKLLRYHVIKVPVVFDLRMVDNTRTMATLLDEKQVIVEYRELTDGVPAGHYIGDTRVIYDTVKPGHVAIISGTLDATVEQPVVTELPPPSNAPTSEDDSGEEAPGDLPPAPPTEEAAAPEGVEEEEQPAAAASTTNTLITTKNYMGSVGKLTEFKQQPLKSLVEKMNNTLYSSSAIASSRASGVKSVDIVVRHYNTDCLFEKYSTGKLRDVNRALLSQRHSLQFTASQQRQISLGNGGAQMTEYTVSRQQPQILKRDLLNGLVELCFTNPLNADEATLLMTKIQPTIMETNTYMTDNEHVLLRFQDQVLHTILINHKHDMPVCEKSSLTGNHFFELFMGEKTRAALHAGLDRQEFDSTILLHGSWKERAKRARRSVNRKLSKFLALKVVAASGKQIDVLTAAVEKEAKKLQMPEFKPELTITVQFIDAKYKNRSASETIGAERHLVAPFDLFELEAFNSLFTKMKQVDNRYVKLSAGDDPFFERMTLDIGAVNASSKTWMARDDKHVYVFWATAGSLSYIAILERKSKWAQGL